MTWVAWIVVGGAAAARALLGVAAERSASSDAIRTSNADGELHLYLEDCSFSSRWPDVRDVLRELSDDDPRLSDQHVPAGRREPIELPFELGGNGPVVRRLVDDFVADPGPSAWRLEQFERDVGEALRAWAESD